LGCECVLLIVAGMVAWKLVRCEVGGQSSGNHHRAIADVERWAEQIIHVIDERWPVKI
jgi:hypothetical protein